MVALTVLAALTLLAVVPVIARAWTRLRAAWHDINQPIP